MSSLVSFDAVANFTRDLYNECDYCPLHDDCTSKGARTMYNYIDEYGDTCGACWDLINEMLYSGDYVETRHGETVHIDRAVYCEDIGEYVLADGGGAAQCSECGRWFYWDSCDAGDGTLCEECATNLDDSRIADYHSGRGRYCYNHFGRADGNFREIGIELEVDRDTWNATREACAVDAVLAALGGSHVYFERDSSLDYGFEIITMPHSFTQIMSLDWEAACAGLLENGYTSHDAGTCGMHLHFSKQWLGETKKQRARVLGLVTEFYQRNFATMVILSRRTAYQVGRWCEAVDIPRETPTEKGELMLCDDSYSNHYNAINTSNINRLETIEFRLGRGTLNAATIRAWIDIHRAIIETARALAGVDDSVINYAPRVWLAGVRASTREYIETRIDKLV